MNNEEYVRVMEAWLNQLQQGSQNPSSPQKSATQFTIHAGSGLRQLSEEIESHIEDTEVEEWLQACLADEIPVAVTYPRVDLSFLPTLNWSADTVRKAIEQGKQWVHDQMNAVYILFGQLLQDQQAVAWAVRSRETDQPIFHRILNEEKLGWEIEISAFAQNKAICRIEVAIFRPEDPGAALDNVAIMLRIADQPPQTLTTDIGGVVEFADIPLAKLDQVVVRIAQGD